MILDAEARSTTTISVLCRNFLYSIVYFILNGLHQTFTFLYSSPSGPKYLRRSSAADFSLATISSSSFCLSVFQKGKQSGTDSSCTESWLLRNLFDFTLPLSGGLLQLFIGTFVGRNIFQDIFHVNQGELHAPAVILTANSVKGSINSSS